MNTLKTTNDNVKKTPTVWTKQKCRSQEKLTPYKEPWVLQYGQPETTRQTSSGKKAVTLENLGHVFYPLISENIFVISFKDSTS